MTKKNEELKEGPLVSKDSWVQKASHWLFFSSVLTAHPIISLCAKSHFENGFLSRQSAGCNKK
jgi:hypothetical protein